MYRCVHRHFGASADEWCSELSGLRFLPLMFGDMFFVSVSRSLSLIFILVCLSPIPVTRLTSLILG